MICLLSAECESTSMMKLIIPVITAFVLLAGCSQSSAPASSTEKEVSLNGRYQLMVNPNAPTDTLLLDTQTGKVWQRRKFSYIPGEPIAWTFMERVDDVGQVTTFEAYHNGLKPLNPPKRHENDFVR